MIFNKLCSLLWFFHSCLTLTWTLDGMKDVQVEKDSALLCSKMGYNWKFKRHCLTQSNKKKFYVKDGFDKASFYKKKVKTLLKNFNSLQVPYLGNTNSSLSISLLRLILNQLSPPCKLDCLLFLKQILHFKLLIHILCCPLSPKYPYSFIWLKKIHLLFFRLISKTTFCIKSL